jgi:alcohol dehydrogenase (NADP+)
VPKKPEDFAFDQYPVSDTWKGMEKAQEEGLTRHIGVSNFSAKKLGALMDGARVKPEMNQVEIHAYMQQHDLVDFCKAHDIHVTAYAPLGSSDRPAVLKARDEPVLLEDPTIREIANEKGCSVAQVLLAWTIHRGIAVIPKSVNPGRMKENLEAAELQLSEADMQKISEINKDRRYVDGSMWVMEGGPITLSNLWDE